MIIKRKQEKNMYYLMENIENFRDLGGISTLDNKKVKEGKLFRCADLSSATENDIKKIKQLGIDTIVDFRSTNEALAKKDPEIENIKYYHINLIKDRLDGVERKDKEDNFYEWMIEQSYDYPDRFSDQMIKNYSTLISEEYPLNGYRIFFDILLDEKNDKILWHCSAGKDRTGIAAILILEALGAEKDQIYENYLETNEHLKRSVYEVKEIVKRLAGYHKNYEAIQNSFAKAMSASKDFIDNCYRTMVEKSGTPQIYLQEYLGIDENDRKKLKEKFCEDL